MIITVIGVALAVLFVIGGEWFYRQAIEAGNSGPNLIPAESHHKAKKVVKPTAPTAAGARLVG
jgi:hypothetical protein